MEKVFKVARVIFESYIIGIVILIISAMILALCGVAINPIAGTLKWNICVLIIGLLIYIIKQ